MKTVILAGGFGTRLSELTQSQPKPLVRVGDRPILWHIMKHYSVFGYRDFLICLGYKGEMIRDFFLNYRFTTTDWQVSLGTGEGRSLGVEHGEADWQVALVDTGLSTGTGGRIKRALRYISDCTFLATYGDSVSDVPIDRVVAYHRRMGVLATMCVMHPAQRFGVVSVADGMVASFVEKPQSNPIWINGGFYVFDRGVAEYLSDDCTLEAEPLTHLVADGKVAAYQHEGCHRAMDSLRDVETLNAEWNTGKAAWKTW